ncbi:MAG: monovalent cation/H+ antiporter complex subunit F [Micrococcales bacterium]|nr:monovalent cation/H+ antiporter complex subunit F [Micrococcales bacterium]
MTEQIVVVIVSGILAVSALLSLARMVRGPSIVDRAVANEVLVGVLICALGVEAAVTRHDTTLPILVSLSLVGFLASLAVARFVGGDDATHPDGAAGDPGAGPQTETEKHESPSAVWAAIPAEGQDHEPDR